METGDTHILYSSKVKTGHFAEVIPWQKYLHIVLALAIRETVEITSQCTFICGWTVVAKMATVTNVTFWGVWHGTMYILSVTGISM